MGGDIQTEFSACTELTARRICASYHFVTVIAIKRAQELTNRNQILSGQMVGF